MALHTDIFSQLSGHAGLTALVPSTRITPLQREVGATLPALMFLKVGNSTDLAWGDLCGERVRVQVSIYADADQVAQADAIRDQVLLAMAGFGDFLGDQDLNDTDAEGNKGVIHIPMEFSVYASQ